MLSFPPASDPPARARVDCARCDCHRFATCRRPAAGKRLELQQRLGLQPVRDGLLRSRGGRDQRRLIQPALCGLHEGRRDFLLHRQARRPDFCESCAGAPRADVARQVAAAGTAGSRCFFASASFRRGGSIEAVAPVM